MTIYYCPQCHTELDVDEGGPCGMPASGYCSSCDTGMWLGGLESEPEPEPQGLGVKVLEFIAMNNKLTKLLALMCDPLMDTLTVLPDKLIGDWDEARAGDKITITLLDPYRVEHGVLMALPGLHSDDIMRGGIVHVTEKADDPDTQYWMPLKYLAIMAESLELDPKW